MKRYIWIMILVFAILLLLFYNFNVKGYNQQYNIIYIDPGHGGKDPGAVYGGVKEEDITLKLSLLLKEKLEEKKYVVFLTRDGDYDLANKNAKLRKRSDLYNRSKLINESNCNMYLSIHLNASSDTKWSGPQVFYNNNNINNKMLASSLQSSLNKELNTNRKYMIIKNQYMFDRITKSGVLIEAGFISNPYERNKLQDNDYQLNLVNAIIEGLEKMYIL